MMTPSLSRYRNPLLAVFLVAVTFVAYQPVWHIGYVWGEGIDNDLFSWQGLRHIWTEQGQQTPEDSKLGLGKGYYPLAYSTFWLESHIWGGIPLGYHLDNVLLQAVNAVLLWLILRRLSVPGAWLGAALWALHPVNVESVAGLEERKNTLSGLFYLCAILAALTYWLPRQGGRRLGGERPAEGSQDLMNSPSAEGQRGPIPFYWVTLVLYVLGLLSKTTTIPLPVVILLLVWWKRGRILWGDVRPLLIFCVIGIATGLDTMHVDHNLSAWVWLGNFSKEFALPLVDRFLIAGRDVWFYLGKLLWPHPLIFVYPLWKIDPSSVLAWLQLLAVPALLWLLWLKRHSWGRPVLVALLYFLLLLAPVLSFLNSMFFRISFVADHYQYLACMGPLTLAAAGILTFLGRLGKAGHILKPLLSAGLLSTLGILTWNQCRIYTGADLDTLYRTTVALNPDAWLIHERLGELLRRKGQLDAAVEQVRMAFQIYPNVKLSCELADMLLEDGKPDEAAIWFHKALQIQPDYPLAYDGLGRAYAARGRMDDAIQNFQKALQFQPEMPSTYFDLGNAYIRKGQSDLAIENWQKAVDMQPTFARAQANLANALMSKGQVAQAIQHWEAALAVQPNMVGPQVGLAWVMATCPLPALRDGPDALVLAEKATQLTGGRDPMALRALAAAFGENGQFDNAVAAVQRAIQIANLQGNTGFASSLQPQLKAYQSGQPFRDATLKGTNDGHGVGR